VSQGQLDELFALRSVVKDGEVSAAEAITFHDVYKSSGKAQGYDLCLGSLGLSLDDALRQWETEVATPSGYAVHRLHQFDEAETLQEIPSSTIV
jgi:hypothetical protein